MEKKIYNINITVINIKMHLIIMTINSNHINVITCYILIIKVEFLY